MNHNTSQLDIQQAWQTAFLQRTCPDDATLRTATPDERLKHHLSCCSVCREKRAMPAEQLAAWQGLFDKFTSQVHQAVNVPHPGQVWVLDKKLSRWGEDGYFYSPPNVLLLEESGDDHNFRVAQLYSDERLMGKGDILLSEQFGFAQGWNTYIIDKNSLKCWLGNVTDNQVAEVVRAAAVQNTPIDDNSILSFFRKVEIAVGQNITLATSASLKIEFFLEGLFGSIADVYHKLSKFKLPEYADSLLDLLAGARDPHAVTPLTAATSQPLLVNIIKQHDGDISIKTVAATLTQNNWEDDDYYVAGRFKESLDEELVLVASINVSGKIISEHQSRMEKGTPYFDILFKSVPKEGCAIDNLRFILVKP